MDQALKQSLPARLAAVGFIVVILAGNGWLCYGLMGLPVPEFVSLGFAGGIFLSLLGGAGLATLILKRRFGPGAPEGEG